MFFFKYIDFEVSLILSIHRDVTVFKYLRFLISLTKAKIVPIIKCKSVFKLHLSDCDNLNAKGAEILNYNIMSLCTKFRNYVTES